MSTKKIYGPWVKWDGGECPVPLDTIVEVKFHDGDSQSGHPAYAYYWHHDGDGADILTYCIIAEQPDLDAAEKLLRDNNYTVIPPAKPLTFDDVVPMTEAPPEGTVYWVVSAGEREGVYVDHFFGSDINHRTIKRRVAYLDKEHALVAAKHIFGLKEGEL